MATGFEQLDAVPDDVAGASGADRARSCSAARRARSPLVNGTLGRRRWASACGSGWSAWPLWAVGHVAAVVGGESRSAVRSRSVRRHLRFPGHLSV